MQAIDIQCSVSHLTYSFHSHLGDLFIADNQCTDMTTCIELFRRLDPDVREIRVHEGTHNETIYTKIGEQWTARVIGSNGVQDTANTKKTALCCRCQQRHVNPRFAKGTVCDHCKSERIRERAYRAPKGPFPRPPCPQCGQSIHMNPRTLRFGFHQPCGYVINGPGRPRG